MGLTQTTAPLADPITLAEAKAQCEVDSDYWDTLITGYIKTASIQIENLTGLQLMPASWTLTLDTFPVESCRAIRLPKAPLVQVNSITYANTEGDATIWDPADYVTDATVQPARLLPAYGKSWPTARSQPNAVSIAFDAGYADANQIPPPLLCAIKLIVAHLYKNREATESRALIEIPMGVHSLAMPYAVYNADFGI